LFAGGGVEAEHDVAAFPSHNHVLDEVCAYTTIPMTSVHYVTFERIALSETAVSPFLAR
jgi:hypothetical protein